MSALTVSADMTALQERELTTNPDEIPVSPFDCVSQPLAASADSLILSSGREASDAGSRHSPLSPNLRAVLEDCRDEALLARETPLEADAAMLAAFASHARTQREFEGRRIEALISTALDATSSALSSASALPDPVVVPADLPKAIAAAIARLSDAGVAASRTHSHELTSVSAQASAEAGRVSAALTRAEAGLSSRIEAIDSAVHGLRTDVTDAVSTLAHTRKTVETSLADSASKVDAALAALSSSVDTSLQAYEARVAVSIDESRDACAAAVSSAKCIASAVRNEAVGMVSDLREVALSAAASAEQTGRAAASDAQLFKSEATAAHETLAQALTNSVIAGRQRCDGLSADFASLRICVADAKEAAIAHADAAVAVTRASLAEAEERLAGRCDGLNADVAQAATVTTGLSRTLGETQGLVSDLGKGHAELWGSLKAGLVAVRQEMASESANLAAERQTALEAAEQRLVDQIVASGTTLEGLVASEAASALAGRVELASATTAALKRVSALEAHGETADVALASLAATQANFAEETRASIRATAAGARTALSASVGNIGARLDVSAAAQAASEERSRAALTMAEHTAQVRLRLVAANLGSRFDTAADARAALDAKISASAALSAADVKAASAVSDRHLKAAVANLGARLDLAATDAQNVRREIAVSASDLQSAVYGTLNGFQTRLRHVVTNLGSRLDMTTAAAQASHAKLDAAIAAAVATSASALAQSAAEQQQSLASATAEVRAELATACDISAARAASATQEALTAALTAVSSLEERQSAASAALDDSLRSFAAQEVATSAAVLRDESAALESRVASEAEELEDRLTALFRTELAAAVAEARAASSKETEELRAQLAAQAARSSAEVETAVTAAEQRQALSLQEHAKKLAQRMAAVRLASEAACQEMSTTVTGSVDKALAVAVERVRRTADVIRRDVAEDKAAVTELAGEIDVRTAARCAETESACLQRVDAAEDLVADLSSQLTTFLADYARSSEAREGRLRSSLRVAQSSSVSAFGNTSFAFIARSETGQPPEPAPDFDALLRRITADVVALPIADDELISMAQADAAVKSRAFAAAAAVAAASRTPRLSQSAQFSSRPTGQPLFSPAPLSSRRLATPRSRTAASVLAAAISTPATPATPVHRAAGRSPSPPSQTACHTAQEVAEELIAAETSSLIVRDADGSVLRPLPISRTLALASRGHGVYSVVGGLSLGVNLVRVCIDGHELAGSPIRLLEGFDPALLAPNVATLSHNATRIAKSESSDDPWTVACGSFVCSGESALTYHLRLDAVGRSKRLFIGVIDANLCVGADGKPGPVPSSAVVGADSGVWLFSAMGKTFSGGKMVPFGSEPQPWANGDVISVTIDMSTRSLAVAHNGLDVGSAFRQRLAPAVRLAVVMGDWGTTVSLVDPSTM
jgi:hypothetical protein